MTIIAIGGGEDKTGDMTVLKRVLAETGKTAPLVLVITTATGYPEEVGDNYRRAFSSLGVTPDIRHVTDAEAHGLLEALKKADAVFFSGGDQSKLGAVFGGSAFLAGLASREGDIVIAGTSAGAAAMSSLMITGGAPEGPVTSGAGLGLTPDICSTLISASADACCGFSPCLRRIAAKPASALMKTPLSFLRRARPK